MQPPELPLPHPPPDEIDLQPVIIRARAGDVASFNLLVERYQRQAFNVALRMLGDRDVAADATQEAIVSAFKALGRFRGGSFRVWLLRIVTNQCLDVWRAQQRHRQVSLDALLAPAGEDGSADYGGTPGAFVDSAWDPALLAERKELQHLIQQVLLQLPEDQRVTVVLSDIEGFSYDEIAALTNTNTGTVKSRLARGRAKLREYFARHQELLPREYRHHTRGNSASS
jgi:RNA polymerase sigma-70 factor (ECF subfamily)